MDRTEPEERSCTVGTSLNFIMLLVLRGTTPLMMYYGMLYLRSASLIVALKCEISLILFTISAVCLLRDTNTKTTMVRNLQQKSTYWKLLVFGFLHSTLPYFLMAYGVQYVPITLLSSFIVSTPWFVYALERMCCRGTTTPNTRSRVIHKVGTVLGVVGVVVMVVATLTEPIQCLAASNVSNETRIDNSTIISNNTNNSYVTLHPSQEIKEENATSIVQCPSVHDVIGGIICVALAPLSWAIGAVFWKKHQDGIHHVVSNIGRNAFGGVLSLFAFIFLGIFFEFGHINWSATQWIIYVGYLGIGSGWLSTLLVQDVFSKLGPKLTNQVLTGMPLLSFAEDCLFVRHPFSQMETFSSTFVMELIGLLLVTIGVFATNIPDREPNSAFTYVDLRGSVTERLLTSSREFDYPGHEMEEAPMRDVLLSEQLQYQGGNDDELYNGEAGCTTAQEMEREVLVPLDTEDIRYLMDVPPLGRVDHDHSE